jgi:hypothetical protein
MDSRHNTGRFARKTTARCESGPSSSSSEHSMIGCRTASRVWFPASQSYGVLSKPKRGKRAVGALKSQLGGRGDVRHASPGSPEPHRRPIDCVHDALSSWTHSPIARRAHARATPSRRPPCTSVACGSAASCIVNHRRAPARSAYLDSETHWEAVRTTTRTPRHPVVGDSDGRLTGQPIHTREPTRGAPTWRPALAPTDRSARPPSLPVLRRGGSCSPDPALRRAPEMIIAADAARQSGDPHRRGRSREPGAGPPARAPRRTAAARGPRCT